MPEFVSLGYRSRSMVPSAPTDAPLQGSFVPFCCALQAYPVAKSKVRSAVRRLIHIPIERSVTCSLNKFVNRSRSTSGVGGGVAEVGGLGGEGALVGIVSEAAGMQTLSSTAGPDAYVKST